MSQEKLCYRCKELLPLANFCKRSASNDGLNGICRQCAASDIKRWRIENKEWIATYDKQYKLEHPEVDLNSKRRQYARNPQKVIAHVRAWRANNPEKAAETAERNRKEYLPRRRERYHQQLKHDPLFLLPLNLRNRLRVAIKNNFKKGSAVEDLGCSIEFFKQYIESLFTEGMCWDNWGQGSGCWQLDHIMPLSAFDLSNRQHILLACHYLNLQPLWSEDNNRKKNKLPEMANVYA